MSHFFVCGYWNDSPQKRKWFVLRSRFTDNVSDIEARFDHDKKAVRLGPVLHVLQYSHGVTIVVPCLIVVALIGAIAAVPWIKWRFSLRTLLIGLTVAAIGLGWLVYSLRN